MFSVAYHLYTSFYILNIQIGGQASSGLSLSNVGLNEAAIAEKCPAAASLNNIIHPHPERDFFV
ncbi:hypothetical protein, partial [Candidatus Nitrotoga sp. 1052]|uniref:hypothetical protein n=1 Tax=Candidatus Nitrotoga sp. 1052 TaxID=2886964 RepID=UPI001EF71610